MMVLAPILIQIPTLRHDTFEFGFNLSCYAHCLGHYDFGSFKDKDGEEITYTKIRLTTGFVYFTLLSVYEIEELVKRAAKKLIPKKHDINFPSDNNNNWRY